MPTLFLVKLRVLFNSAIVFSVFFLALQLMIPSAAGAVEIDQNWALQYLLLDDEADLDRAMAEIPGQLEDPKERALAVGILNVYKYLRNDTVSEYAYTAFENLDSLSPPFDDAPFIFAYKGAANSLMAKEKTVFGVGNLKDMQMYMEFIPEEYNDWFVRFLRGSTLIQVGRNLPAIFFRKMKTEAIELGTKDLTFVVEQYRENGVPFFDAETYDREKRPVPYPIFEQSQNFLTEE
jgi:hypothetical protein